jgi:hypothetical protein
MSSLSVAMLVSAAGSPSAAGEPGKDAKPMPPDKIGWNAAGKAGVVAAGNPKAVAAGIDILKASGNAADAAAATIFALNITDHYACSIGGEAPVIIWDARQKQVKVLSGQGRAPLSQEAVKWYMKNGIPGGRQDKIQAASDRFYGRGAAPRDIADELEEFYIQKGGFLRKADLAAHHTPIEDPVTVNYRGYTVCKCGPWTQGPYLLQALRLLEGFDLKKMGQGSPDYIHAVAEALKLALADRDEYYGDPEFVKVPLSGDWLGHAVWPCLSPSLAEGSSNSGDRHLRGEKHAASEPVPFRHLIDIMATCVDLGGAAYPKEFNGKPILPMEGTSLAPAFADKPLVREGLYWEHEGNAGVRVGDLKLVRKGGGGAWELYDMIKDRTELHDQAGERPDKVKELAGLWNAWAQRCHMLDKQGGGAKDATTKRKKKADPKA